MSYLLTLLTGDLPTDWTRANVAPVFKKGSKLQAVNYRPVSLTCITCKLFEHIICRHVLGHLEQHKILTELQHGFRSGRSCNKQAFKSEVKKLLWMKLFQLDEEIYLFY